MTQEEAKRLVHIAILSAMKGKSNLLELVGDDRIGLMVAGNVEPYLFPEEGRINLIEALTRYEEKVFLNRGDVVNIITLVNKSPTTYVGMAFHSCEVPSLLEFLQGEFEEVAYDDSLYNRPELP